MVITVISRLPAACSHFTRIALKTSCPPPGDLTHMYKPARATCACVCARVSLCVVVVQVPVQFHTSAPQLAQGHSIVTLCHTCHR